MLLQQRQRKDARLTSTREVSGLIDVYSIKRRMGGSQKGYMSWHSRGSFAMSKNWPPNRNHHASEDEQGTSRIGDGIRIFSLVTIFDRHTKDGPRFPLLARRGYLDRIGSLSDVSGVQRERLGEPGGSFLQFTHD